MTKSELIERLLALPATADAAVLHAALSDEAGEHDGVVVTIAYHEDMGTISLICRSTRPPKEETDATDKER